MSLSEDIGRVNLIPEYVKSSIARPIPLRSINEENWIEIANDYRRCFILEKQFRKFYVDYLIREIGDQKRFFTECRCQRQSTICPKNQRTSQYSNELTHKTNEPAQYSNELTHKSNELREQSNEPKSRKNRINTKKAGPGRLRDRP